MEEVIEEAWKTWSLESLWETLQSNQDMQDAILTRIRRQVEDETRSRMKEKAALDDNWEVVELEKLEKILEMGRPIEGLK